ncbi:hypothetical protein CSC88_26800, partial [Klebsiella pneumoniae]
PTTPPPRLKGESQPAEGTPSRRPPVRGDAGAVKGAGDSVKQGFKERMQLAIMNEGLQQGWRL